jgi:hypothetical protein
VVDITFTSAYSVLIKPQLFTPQLCSPPTSVLWRGSVYLFPERNSRQNALGDFGRRSLIGAEPLKNYVKLAEFDDLELNVLAMYCRWVSESQNVSRQLVRDAFSLIHKWSSLISVPTTNIEDTNALREQMISFLVLTRARVDLGRR